MNYVPVDEILNFLEPDFKRLRKGQERMAKVWRNEEPDSLPVLVGCGRVPERSNFPHYTLKEQFASKEKMLAEQLWGIIDSARGAGDGQLAMRANLGVGLIPSIFSLKIEFTEEDQMPWVVGHLSKDQIKKLKLPDVEKAGLMPKALEYIAYFQEKLSGKAHVYLSDTQGPFDIAHLLRGPAIYYDLYDDPAFVHHLMHLSTEVYVQVSRILKEAIGEPLDSGFHGNMYMENGGVRLCDDSSINISNEMYREFIQPYIEQALAPFGGGWVHFCGDGKHLLDSVLEIDLVKGINFGNPELYDFAQVLPKLIKRGKFYTGPIPAKEGEVVEDYIQRIASYMTGYKKGLILHGIPVRKKQNGKLCVQKWHEFWQDSKQSNGIRGESNGDCYCI